MGEKTGISWCDHTFDEELLWALDIEKEALRARVGELEAVLEEAHKAIRGAIKYSAIQPPDIGRLSRWLEKWSHLCQR